MNDNTVPQTSRERSRIKAISKENLKKLAKNLLLFVSVIILAGIWQTRNMPRGEAPTSYASSPDTAESVQIPSKSETIEILYFFAPWCTVCKYSAPNARLVGQWFPSIKLTFVALDYVSTDEVTGFANEYIKAPVVLGDVTVQQAWSISAFPSYAIINPDNKVSHRSVGYSTSIGMAFWVFLTKIGFL